MKYLKNGVLTDIHMERERRLARREKFQEALKNSPHHIDCECGATLVIDDYEKDICKDRMARAEHSFILNPPEVGMRGAYFHCPACKVVHGVYASSHLCEGDLKVVYAGQLVRVADHWGMTDYATKEQAAEIERRTEEMRKNSDSRGKCGFFRW